MKKLFILNLCAGAALALAGCATPAQTGGLVVGGVTLAGARTPSQDLEQIYYVGVFDPEEQIPPSFYRLTVRGQASAMSNTRFASGWVPAGIIDSLNGQLSYNPNDDHGVGFTQTNDTLNARLNLGRRFVMFGPEGFREAPRDHRLVIVMGASPKAFFDAVDGALGEISGVTLERSNTLAARKLTDAITELSQSREKLLRIELDAANKLPAAK